MNKVSEESKKEAEKVYFKMVGILVKEFMILQEKYTSFEYLFLIPTILSNLISHLMVSIKFVLDDRDAFSSIIDQICDGIKKESMKVFDLHELYKSPSVGGEQ